MFIKVSVICHMYPHPDIDFADDIPERVQRILGEDPETQNIYFDTVVDDRSFGNQYTIYTDNSVINIGEIEFFLRHHKLYSAVSKAVAKAIWEVQYGAKQYLSDN